MTLTVNMIIPHLEDIKSGARKQSELAEAFGVSQPALSRFIKRNFGDDARVGKGGRHPTTTDTMLQAVAECENPAVKIADVARKYGYTDKGQYLALARRVQKRRDKLAAEEKAAAQAERDALLAQIPAKQFPVPQDDADARLLTEILADPQRLIKVASVIRAAGL